MVLRFISYVRSNSLLRNAGFIFSTSIATSGLGFVFWFLAAKLFSPSDVGVAQIVIAGMLSIVSISLFGFNLSLLRYLPKEKDPSRLLDETFSISLGVGLILSLGYVVFLPVLVPESIAFSGWFFGLFFVLSTLTWTYGVLLDTVFTAFRKTESILGRNVLLSVIKILALFVPLGPVMLFVGWGLGSMLSLVLALWIGLRRVVAYRFTPRFSFTKIRGIAPLSLSNYLSWGFNYLAIWVFGLFLAGHFSAADAGYFSIAWNIATIFFVTSLSIAQSLISEASNDGAHTARLIRKAVKYTAYSVIPMTLIAYVFRRAILGLFSPAYLVAADAFGILLLSAWVVSAISLYTAIQNIEDNPRRVFGLNMVRLAGLLILSFMLIPSGGLVGASLAWVGANGLGILYMFQDYSRVKAWLH